MKFGKSSRWALGIAGAALAVYAVTRRSVGGALVSLAGGDFIHRGLGWRYLRRALGLGAKVEPRYKSRIRVEQALTVDRPPEEVYAFWRKLENLPRFLDRLQAVTRLDERRSHWVAKGPANTTIEWDTEIIREIPDKLIVWRSPKDSGMNSAGLVHLQRLPEGRGTKVKVALRYEVPSELLEPAFSKLLAVKPSETARAGVGRAKQTVEAGEVLAAQGHPAGGTRPKQVRTIKPRRKARLSHLEPASGE